MRKHVKQIIKTSYNIKIILLLILYIIKKCL